MLFPFLLTTAKGQEAPPAMLFAVHTAWTCLTLHKSVTFSSICVDLDRQSQRTRFYLSLDQGVWFGLGFVFKLRNSKNKSNPS